MPYVLSPSEKSSLAAVYANVKNPAHPDFNKYFLAYDALYDIITDFTGLFPKAGVDPSAWLWLQSAKACSEYPRHAVARSFFKPAESGEVSYVVDCPGGRSLDPAAAATARLDPMTEYWRADGPTATGQLGGPRCTLRGHWGEWRFEALVDRDQPEHWGNIHAHVLKLYERLAPKGGPR